MSIKNNKVMSIIFISTCACFLLFLFLSQWEFLNRISYSLHEICYLPVALGFFLIPIEAVIGIIIWIKYRREKDSPAFINTVLNVASLVILCACISIYTFLMNGVITSGVIKDFEKYSINQGYYIKIDDKMIEITQEQFNILEVGKWYSFEYKHNNLIPNKYTMTSFSPME